jgi:hypothetical protein
MLAEEISVKRYVVRLSGEERERLETLLRKGKSPAQHRRWERANWQQEELQFSTEGGSLHAVARAG